MVTQSKAALVVITVILSVCSFTYELLLAKTMTLLIGYGTMTQCLSMGVFILGLSLGTFYVHRKRENDER